jgi:hypothetical protein
MPLDAFAQELIGLYPGLTILPARILINRAWQDIRDEGLWSFLTAEDAVVAPLAVIAGTVTTTLGSSIVTGDANAAAAWTPLALANPPLASPNIGVGRQFRVGAGQPVYNIVGYNGTNQITLDRLYTESTNVGAGQIYQIYKAYYAVPQFNGVTDFLRYLTITNVNFAYSIVGKFLSFNREQLDRMDPQRGSFGDAYVLGSYKVDPNTFAPVHELWPNPTDGCTYMRLYQRRGQPMTPAGVTPVVDYPPTLSPSLLMARAEYQTSLWAVKNLNRYPDLKGINWFSVRREALVQYKDELVKQRRQDMEIFKNTWILPKGQYLGFPVDAAFIQSHDVDLMFMDVG